MWSRGRNGDMSRDGLYRARFFRFLLLLWEEEPQPIKQALKEIRAEETKAIKFVPGYAGAWRARRIQTVNQWRKEK